MTFPLDVTGPIRVSTALDDAAVERLLANALTCERRHAEALGVAAERTGDPALTEVRNEVERHVGALEQLARDLGAAEPGQEPPTPDGDPETASSGEELVAAQRRSGLGWTMLQRVAYASGDKRIDRAVKPVLREKERHARVVSTFAAAQATRGLYPEPEE